MFVAFTFVCFAFLGLGLVIAMLADTVPAVQALGQAVFLPMIIIGGVGVPLRTLPNWAAHVAGFLPGRYAVETLQVCMNGPGLEGAPFGEFALTVIGLAACLAGAKLFRWDAGQKLSAASKAWVALAVLAWGAVGVLAEATGRLTVAEPAQSSVSGDEQKSILGKARSTQSIQATQPTQPATQEAGPLVVHQKQPWEDVTDDDLKKVEYDDLPDPNGTVVPLASDLDNLEDDAKKRLESFAEKLADWKPGKVEDVGQRVRNLLSVCAVTDLIQDPLEPQIPFVVFEKLKSEIPKEQLKKAAGWVAIKPEEGTVVLNIADLGLEGEMPEPEVRERTGLYAKRLLMQLLGKDKPPEK